ISGTDAGNYTFNTTASTTADITARALTVTADSQTEIYGSIDPTLTYQVTSGSLVGGDGFSGSLTRAPGEDVGSYALQQGTLTAGGNYDLTYVGANLAITPATLTVTANPQTKVYGQSDPALTYGVSGLQFADTAAGVLTGSLSRAVGEHVGSYAISQGTLAADSDYTITFTGSTLTITSYAFTYQIGNDSQTYSSPANLATDLPATIATGVNGETLAISYASTGDTTTAHVGSYAIIGEL